MLYRGLEELIQKGKAQYKTFTFGGSGVATIPVPNNTFIIIVDFDYWHFIDPNPVGACGTIDIGEWEEGDCATFCIQQNELVVGNVCWQGTPAATATALMNDINTNHSADFSATIDPLNPTLVTVCANEKYGASSNGWLIVLCNFLAQENLDLILQQDSSKIVVT